jgi:hypothetical protein
VLQLEYKPTLAQGRRFGAYSHPYLIYRNALAKDQEYFA